MLCVLLHASHSPNARGRASRGGGGGVQRGARCGAALCQGALSPRAGACAGACCVPTDLAHTHMGFLQARLALGELRLALADAEAARAVAPRDAAAVELVEAVEDALYDAGDAHQAAAPVPAQAAEEAPTEDQLAFARRCASTQRAAISAQRLRLSHARGNRL